MGAGASADAAKALKPEIQKTAEELAKAVMDLPEEERKKTLASITALLPADKPPEPPKEMIVYYWGPNAGMNMYGRGIGIYLTLDQAGVKWTNKAPSEAPEGGSMAPPCVVIDGVSMGQTPVVLLKLGEMYGLGGKTAEEKMRCMQAVEDMNDIFGEHAKFKDDKDLKKKRFDYLEKKYDKKWLAGGEEPTVADFHGVFAFEWIKKKEVDISEFPNTTKWLKNITDYPVVKAMYASCKDGRSMIP